MSTTVNLNKKARRNLLNHSMAKNMMKGNFESSIGLMTAKPKFENPRLS